MSALRKSSPKASEVEPELHQTRASAGVSDAAVVGRVLAGDRNAYRLLIEKYQSALVACAWQRVQTRIDAEEAAQEAFVLGYERLGKLREPKYFFTWVWRICANVALKAQRKAKRRRVGLVEDHRAEERSAPIEIDERNQELMHALSALPEDQRQVLTLRFWEGMAYTEIGELLGVSQDALYQRVSRGLKRVKEVLGEDFLAE